MSSSINPLMPNTPDPVASRADSTIQRVAEASFENELAALQMGQTESTPNLSEFANLLGDETPDTNSFVQEAGMLQRLTACLASPAPLPTMPSCGNLTPGSVQIPSNIQPNGYPQFAAQNNNPGNLMFARQSGATLGAGGFAQFATPEDGYHALLSQVRLDANRGLTLEQYISKYAPPAENDTALYIQQASQALGVDVSTPLANINPEEVAAFQARKESGTTIL